MTTTSFNKDNSNAQLRLEPQGVDPRQWRRVLLVETTPINDATNTITIHRQIFDSAYVQAHRVCPHDHTPKSHQGVKSVTERGVLYWLHFMMRSGASGGENPPITRNDIGGGDDGLGLRSRSPADSSHNNRATGLGNGRK